MSGPVKALLPLKREQALGATPDLHAWVAASAGTGKTQVLSARVLRLLLLGTPPHAILCLTFTKLAAAEMQKRVLDRLARWARCDADGLASDLAALGAATDDATVARARRLFAQVLDAPAGLAVQTIHAFAQGLIAGFPVESGVAPGFATLDDRGGMALRRRLLAEAIEAAARDGDDAFLADLAEISIAGGEQRMGAVAARLMGHGEALAGLATPGMEPMLRRGFGLPTDGDGAAALAAHVAGFDMAGLVRLAGAMEHGHKNATTKLVSLLAWLGSTDKVASLDTLVDVFLTQKETVRDKMPGKEAALRDPWADDFYTEFAIQLIAIRAEQRLYAAAAHAARHLRVGKRLAADWQVAKARLGVVDYDDMIVAAQRLLLAPGAADWVRYKLDQRIDHVLVDEAQDTNSRQWEIVRALIGEFFAGVGARDTRRTLFVVGDYKQSIFGFQGADPTVYRDKRDDFGLLATDAGDMLEIVDLSINFRSVAAVLDVVDGVIETLGAEAFDSAGVLPHKPHRENQAGRVTLWPPVLPAGDEEGDDDESGPAPKAEITMAHNVAAAIAGWLDPAAPMLVPSTGKPVGPQDILVLVRSRSAFSGALVAALHEHDVPVAGVDRLKLTDPLAVADLLALARFALQPGDDLTLATLLVSPFVALDHDRLFALADGRTGPLWDRVRDSADPQVVAAAEWLGQVLGLADFTAPYEFFERILSGPLQGRQKLLARLGEEARDAIDAVLDQALAFESANAPSLQGFLAWVEADDIDIKRDPDAPLDAVRLMTVHGAKGLQAPVVILADTCKPRRKEREAPVMMSFDRGPPLPVFLADRKNLTGRLAAAVDAQDEDAEREHCRLLYVALTRAEDLLYVGGALSGKQTEPSEDSWYHHIKAAMETLGATEDDLDPWDGPSLVHARGRPAPRMTVTPVITPDDARSLPDWAVAPAPQEARPPRPLSPSAIAADDVAAPPTGPAARAAARRGQALHALFERLPEIAADRRRMAGEAWCRMSVPELDAAELTGTVLGIMADPRFAPVFAADALAEAPIAAVVGGTVIAGTVDRLVIGDDVLVVDFKTGRRVPADAQAVEPYHLKQMAAYVAALQRVFPGKPVRAALLYTEGPALIELPDAMVALHAPQGDVVLNGADAAPISPE
ncbi:double-strand break repair helicase AddA [Sandarakinorhabdus sp. DWP1-3-1]|uniref:double-strand break repair helicase AddA n=1 Tax=Sandarakinorhabdus sp. DWP1-3-1 TaxID=2804627 RepID=UPI003CF9DDAE